MTSLAPALRAVAAVAKTFGDFTFGDSTQRSQGVFYMHSLRSLALLTAAITLVGAICLVATFSHAAHNPFWPVLFATTATLSGILPPLWIASRIKDGPSKQLAIIGTRLLIMLPTIMFSGVWQGVERKCFLTTLLACYFIALPLESWLLIREVRRSGD